jgi:hypothetical protein
MRQKKVPPSTRRYRNRVSIIYTDVSSDHWFQCSTVACRLWNVAELDSLDGTIIVLANFLLETKEQSIPLSETDFTGWMQQHREISSVLSKSTLD